ncbi:MAG: hypothetical protein IIB95_05195 [Candidatus Marinimicrobia bacterium]|nr:hypothetical protein [Candidatus Neomarinimicrobiota bacterium]MCH7763123.1 hypothetical protein [Candidatus Neomarinimicrobiota bacterium]
MRKFRSIIVIGIISIGLGGAAFGISDSNNNKKADENKEKISCIKNTSSCEQNNQSSEKTASFENCENKTDKSASGKTQQKKSCCSKKKV